MSCLGVSHTIFTRAVLTTSFALVANDSVFLVCSTWLKDGLTVHIIAVRAFPPSEDCNIRVSFESLYGMWPCIPQLQSKRKIQKQNQTPAKQNKIPKAESIYGISVSATKKFTCCNQDFFYTWRTIRNGRHMCSDVIRKSRIAGP